MNNKRVYRTRDAVSALFAVKLQRVQLGSVENLMIGEGVEALSSWMKLPRTIISAHVGSVGEEGGASCVGMGRVGVVNQSVGGRPDICVEISCRANSVCTVMAWKRASSPIVEGVGMGRKP